jgi:hypothetical protein
MLLIRMATSEKPVRNGIKADQHHNLDSTRGTRLDECQGVEGATDVPLSWNSQSVGIPAFVAAMS